MARQPPDVLIRQLAAILRDYRKGSWQQVTVDRIKRWIDQFEPQDQPIILYEMVHILRQRYVSYGRARYMLKHYLEQLVTQTASGNLDRFLSETCFLNLQTHLDDGQSQGELIQLARDILAKGQPGAVQTSDTSRNTAPKRYVYLDDGVYSGKKLCDDLISDHKGWITRYDGPPTTLFIYTLIDHSLGDKQALDQILPKARLKRIDIQIRCGMYIHNSRINSDRFECLWPSTDYGDRHVRQYAESLAKERMYTPTADLGIYRPRHRLPKETLFSSPEARAVVERAFLLRGLELRQRTQYTWIRPLGFDRLATFGFGTFAIPYRNCPNNAPLVLWWSAGGWEPLLQRYDHGRQVRYVQRAYAAPSYDATWTGIDALDDVPF